MLQFRRFNRKSAISTSMSPQQRSWHATFPFKISHWVWPQKHWLGQNYLEINENKTKTIKQIKLTHQTGFSISLTPGHTSYNLKCFRFKQSTKGWKAIQNQINLIWPGWKHLHFTPLWNSNIWGGKNKSVLHTNKYDTFSASAFQPFFTSSFVD